MTTHENKIAIVTGSRLGIGRGVAELLDRRGVTVVAVNRSDATDVVEAIGNGAVAIATDVTCKAD